MTADQKVPANVAKLPELLRSAKGSGPSSTSLPLIIAATFLGKFSCQFEQGLGFVEVDVS